MVAAWNDLPPPGEPSECATLVELAERWHGSAPELVVPYARQVLAGGPGVDGALVIRAQALLAAALVRLGRYGDAVEPGLVALRGADHSGVPELGWSVRLDLAACTVGLGEPLLGCAILRPVLDAAASRPATRAVAIAQLVSCTAHVGRRDDLEDSLAEAERLLAADDVLSADVRRVERALLAIRTAAYHRRWGETEDAIEAARDGLGQLARLRDARLEAGRVRAGLVLELVCAMLDDGHLVEAEQEAETVLGQPVRAASAPAVGRLLLAIATRVLLPAGRVEAGRRLLDHVTWLAERHGLDWLLADGLTARADLDERAARPLDALQALRAAHAAEHRHRRSTELARRRLMTEFGVGDYPLDVVNSLLRNVIRPPAGAAPAVRPADDRTRPILAPPGHAAPRVPAKHPPAAHDRAGDTTPRPPDTDEATGLLTREGLSRRLAAVRRVDRPVALTLVRLETEPSTDRRPTSGDDQSGPGTEALTTLAGRVRDLAPDDAELARPAGSELAVLLPHTTRDQAEELAATIRESAHGADWLTSGPDVNILTGVAESGSGPDEDADDLLTAARQTLTADRPAPTTEDSFLPGLAAATAPKPSDAPQDRLTRNAPAIPESRGPRDTPRHSFDTNESTPEHEPPAADTTRPVPSPTRQPNHTSEPAEPSSTLDAATLRFSVNQPSSAPLHGRRHERATDDPSSGSAARYASDQDDSTSTGAPADSSDEADTAQRAADPATAAGSGGFGSSHEPEPGRFAFGSNASAATHGSSSTDESGPADLSRAGGLAGFAFGYPESADVADPGGGQFAFDRGGSVEGEPPGDDPEYVREVTRDEPGLAIRELLAPLLDHPILSRHDRPAPAEELPETRYTVPPEPEPDEIPEPPPLRPGTKPTSPTDPDEPPRPPQRPDIIIPEEPDQIPPIPPGPEPAPEVPPPAQIPAEPPEDDSLDDVLGPVQGPEPRPPDLPPRADRGTLRRTHADATSIADLLTEALVAYQSTGPEDDEPEPPPTPNRTQESTPPAHRTHTGAGRHRMPDWASVDFDNP